MKIVKDSGVFLSLQGEGTLTGIPTVFVRAFGCNTKCKWCDQPEAWGNEDNSVDVSVEGIVARIMHYNCPNICFTGGEPLLQYEEIADICKGIMKEFFVPEKRATLGEPSFSIETNASVYAPLPLIDFYSFSPKLWNWPDRTMGLWLDYCLSVKTPFQVKVVCDSLRDAQLALAKVGIAKRFLTIQPMWKGAGAESTTELVEFCINSGVRLSVQLHKYMGIE